MRSLKLLVVLVSLALITPATMQAQATATVSGTVSDPTGAVVPGAEVALTDTATNLARSQQTNPAGQYIFVGVSPGVYKLAVTMQGFRQAVVPALKVDVAKAHLVNITLEVGTVAEVVEVMAGAAVELQTTDATVGYVVSGDMLKYAPMGGRDVTSLLQLQPLVIPGRGVGTLEGGQVAGARSDQNTFFLDGGDATSNVEGTGGYNTGQAGVAQAMIPTPADSIEEFRVGTSNPTAAFGRSAGGAVSLVSKRGSNSLHGSAYWYHQNDDLNANTWVRNRTGRKNPESKQNRFGFSGGGPIIKDKIFVFGHFEGWRFPRSADTLRLVPTTSLKSGVLRFRDASGTVRDYDLRTTTACGVACDPRALGISPVVRAVWALMPAGNDPLSGDGLNTIGFRSPASVPFKSNFAMLRWDYNIGQKWTLFSTYRYFSQDEPSTAQLDIAGLTPGAKAGEATPTSGNPLEPRYVVWGLTGQITPRLTNTFNFSWSRHWWEWERAIPFPQVSGTNAALAIAGEGVNSFVDEPVNVDTQNSRSRVWNGRVSTFRDDATWVKGRHTISFGGAYRAENNIHQRNDKVVGSIAALVSQVTDGPGLVVPSANRPATCSATVTSNCLQSGDVTRWNVLYAATLGIIDTSSVLIARDNSLAPLPVGTQLREVVTMRAFDVYVNDVWRIRPSLTLSLGLNYNLQYPPTEKDNKQTLMVTNEGILTTRDYLRRRRAAALLGEFYNPTIGFMPVAQTGRKYPFDMDKNNFGPRLAAAWNPSFQSGVLGRVFGDRKTVLRGGYSLSYERLNGVGLVMIPILGVGFGQTITCRAPDRSRVCRGTGGTTPTTAFRIGVDGSVVPLPAVAPVTAPVQPTINTPFELLSFQIDTERKVPPSHGIDFTIQRELPGNLLLEFGYVGRKMSHLYQGVDLNQVPFFMTDPRSGQTFAQAFDAVATALRTGRAVTAQPWFENWLGAGATLTLASDFAGEFRDGFVTDLWQGGIEPFLSQFATNQQVFMYYQIADLGRANYNAGFVALHKRMSHGLAFDVNYTLSRTNDQIGLNQQFLNSASNAFDLNFDFGPAIFDRRHVLNANWFYQLPFGKGRKWSSGNWVDKLVGGWFTGGIFTASSGLPLPVYQGACQEWGAGLFGNCAMAVPLRKQSFGNTPHRGVSGSAGVGTGGDVNLFADPVAALNSFRKILISQDGRSGGAGVLRGQARWNLDLSVGKKTQVSENIAINFSFDFINALNRMEFGDPVNDLTNPSRFGVLSTQFGGPRVIQFGFRVEF